MWRQAEGKDMSKFGLFTLILTNLLLNAEAAGAKPISYQLPDETAAFEAGANVDVIRNNCTACHSADYIKTQPRGPSFNKEFWKAEVLKMIKVFGAPIDDADVPTIIDYLSEHY